MRTDGMTEAGTVLRELFEEERPCEIAGHGRWPHEEGPGIWYVSAKCPACGHAATDLMCDQLKTALVLDELTSECGKCGHEVEQAWESVLDVTRR